MRRQHRRSQTATERVRDRYWPAKADDAAHENDFQNRCAAPARCLYWRNDGRCSMFMFKKVEMPSAAQALPGRSSPIPTAREHFILHRALKGPYPQGLETAMFGMGCFWGAERKFWELGEGIHVTAVGYAAGYTPNPTYQEVCTGRTGHNEVVLVVYDPK